MYDDVRSKRLSQLCATITTMARCARYLYQKLGRPVFNSFCRKTLGRKKIRDNMRERNSSLSLERLNAV